MKGDQITRIDVKYAGAKMSVSKSNAGAAIIAETKLKRDQIEAGVKPLYVSPDGVCSFNIETIRKKYTAAFKRLLEGA